MGFIDGFVVALGLIGHDCTAKDRYILHRRLNTGLSEMISRLVNLHLRGDLTYPSVTLTPETAFATARTVS